MVVMMLDVVKGEIQKVLLEKEFEDCGICLNCVKLNIYFKLKKGGGVVFNFICFFIYLDEKFVMMIFYEYKIFNVEVFIREDCIVDQLIDVICGNRIYLLCVYVYNKIDCIFIEEVDRLVRFFYFVVVSCEMELNLDYLMVQIWEYFVLLRIYIKKRGDLLDFNGGLIFRRGVIVEYVCYVIYRIFIDVFKYVLVWGISIKYSLQRVGINYVMNDEDVIQVMKK